ncbi:uncharacterized protein LOC121548023 [Coregonus clupeaformis]|uniref:uncharacterized protein LOC121548023 n=1 Tax=Coregonus clupeaformis TaxID=59861 RepID=UPI001BE05E24|nr:uncharacterized protein LOC121548023 [Coregonus clupeaformis]
MHGWICTTDTFDQLFFKTLMTWKKMRDSSFSQLEEPSTTLPMTYKGFMPIARRIFETNTKASFRDAEKSLVADYLAHTTATADRHYRMKTPGNACMVSKLISKVAMSSKSDSETAGPSCASTSYGTGALSSSQKLDQAQALNLFYQHFPVTVDGQSIKKKDRLLIAGKHERFCYDKWRSQQGKMRRDYVIGKTQLKYSKEDGEVWNVILFIAKRDIPVQEELLFDYGVSRKYFGGVREDLERLDS